MLDEKSIYPKIETGFAFTAVVNREIVVKMNAQTIIHGGAIVKVPFYNPSDLIFLHLLVRESQEDRDK